MTQPSGLRRLAVLLVGVGIAAAVRAETNIKPADAKDHVGESVTVCGMVASTKFAESTRRQPTFLNLDRPYPDHIFTVLIWGADRSKFGTPERDYQGKRICVRGVIKLYRGKPEIIASEPSQITVQK